jgi:hypothetical protein
MAKCPHCDNSVFSVNIQEISVMATAAHWRGVSYACPSCNSILGVGIDPVALKTDTVEAILAALRKR